MTSPKKPAPQDWHPADVLAALRKVGWSVRQLALVHGYASGTTLARAMYQPAPRSEALIAAELGIPPQDIWPSRYGPDGKSNRVPGRRPMRPAHRNGRPAAAAASTQK